MDSSQRSRRREEQPRARRQTCYRADLPEQLRACLAERGLSQAKLSQHTSIDPSTLSKILNGKRRPNTAQLGALAYVLDIELDELLVLPNVLAELDELRAERDEAIRRVGEAEAAHWREQTARARAESAATERVAELEAKLEDAARAQREIEAELKRVERELATAKLRLGELDDGEACDPKPKSGRSGESGSTVEFIDLSPPEFNERLATVQRTGEMIETIGAIGGKIGSLIYRALA